MNAWLADLLAITPQRSKLCSAINTPAPILTHVAFRFLRCEKESIGAARGNTRAMLLRRWLNVLLRAAHLVAVIHLALALFLPSTAATDHSFAATATLISGVALLLVELWSLPSRVFELSTVSIGVKLTMIAALVLLPEWQLALFWAVVVWSVLFAHAPASFRHADCRRLFAPH